MMGPVLPRHPARSTPGWSCPAWPPHRARPTHHSDNDFIPDTCLGARRIHQAPVGPLEPGHTRLCFCPLRRRDLVVETTTARTGVLAADGKPTSSQPHEFRQPRAPPDDPRRCARLSTSPRWPSPARPPTSWGWRSSRAAAVQRQRSRPYPPSCVPLWSLEPLRELAAAPLVLEAPRASHPASTGLTHREVVSWTVAPRAYEHAPLLRSRRQRAHRGQAPRFSTQASRSRNVPPLWRLAAPAGRTHLLSSRPLTRLGRSG